MTTAPTGRSARAIGPRSAPFGAVVASPQQDPLPPPFISSQQETAPGCEHAKITGSMHGSRSAITAKKPRRDATPQHFRGQTLTVL